MLDELEEYQHAKEHQKTQGKAACTFGPSSRRFFEIAVVGWVRVSDRK
jgi:hypothetical protein